jgi:hypothetical protein
MEEAIYMKSLLYLHVRGAFSGTGKADVIVLMKVRKAVYPGYVKRAMVLEYRYCRVY